MRARTALHSSLATLLMAGVALGPLSAKAQNANNLALPEINVEARGQGEATGSWPQIIAQPAGQPVTSLNAEQFKNTPAVSIDTLLRNSPGLSFKQGNGPRDIGISIRGSNARNGFGVRNITVFEDGFPVTQPDGLSRTDLTDPNAYGGIDVYRGPSSALFGNYATGGAVNFRTKRGADLDGGEYGVQGGSFGNLSNYVLLGKKMGIVEASLFLSDVRGNGHLSHSGFNTETVNFLGTIDLTPNDKLVVKFINNYLEGNLPIRQSLNQYRTNPLQKGCEAAATAAAGCPTLNLFNNGFGGATTAQTADQAGLHRNDRRTIIGARWEHNFDANTLWRTQLVYDDRNISQPTGTTGAVGEFPSYNFSTDVTKQDKLLGFDVTHFLGFYYNTISSVSDTFNVAPGGGAALGRKTARAVAEHTNIALRAREEVKLNDQWTAIAGLSYEFSKLKGTNQLFTYPGGITNTSFIDADRSFYNFAPELGLSYRPADEWTLRARVGTGYGTPSIGNLFVTPAGVAGNNTALNTQKNLGFDAGFDWTPLPNLKLSVTGFYEFFRNELVTQSAGVGLQSFTFNAPKSEHRGIELAANWGFAKGWNLIGAYTYNDQYYTDYIERLSSTPLSRTFDRKNNKIPGVSPNELTARLSYDQPDGPLKGLGAYVEMVWKDGYFIDNANILKIPGYELFNVNVHYNTTLNNGYFKDLSLFVEGRNIFDKNYIASANNITNSISGATGLQNSAAILSNSGGSIYAGQPRAIMGGMKVSF
jgi:iron complex outermembrane recepter protein